MVSYFYDEEGNIKESLLTDKAKLWAESFINPKRPKERWHKNPPLTSTQLRKFHFEVKTFEERLKEHENPEEEFKKLKPLIKLLKSKVAYSCRTPKSKERKVPEEFREYIDKMINEIKEYKDFKAFALCFESVVGFFYGEGGR